MKAKRRFGDSVTVTPNSPHFLPPLFPMENDEDQTELQLLPSPFSIPSSSRLPPESSSLKYRSGADNLAPSLDLKLSISLEPMIQPQNQDRMISGSVEALKWQAAEQIRLAAMEKAYAERVRELTKREMEMAESEFARARNMWQRAREEVEKAERLKETATRQIDSSCLEITCQSCRQRFRS